MDGDIEEQLLQALRQIMRGIDLYSRSLAQRFGLTGPQLVCLRAVAAREAMMPSELAKSISLSQATITGIVDRLSARGLVTRERTARDRRVVTVRITDAGRSLVEQAPSPLQERFAERLRELPADRQVALRDALRQVASMMGVDRAELAEAELAVLGELPPDPAP